jgi:hypothetical protein
VELLVIKQAGQCVKGYEYQIKVFIIFQWKLSYKFPNIKTGIHIMPVA